MHLLIMYTLRLLLLSAISLLHTAASEQLVFSNHYGPVTVEPASDGSVHFYHEEYPDHRMRATQPNLCAENAEQWSGYLDLPNDRHLFFWLHESQNDPLRDPVVLWLNGGPGCSSITGQAMELGPCRISRDEETYKLSLVQNPYSWNLNASVIFLDQPVGVGFSHGNDTDRGVWGSHAAAADAYTFLQIWFDVFKKDFGRNKLHIAGESYAGRYIPLIAEYTMEQNKHSKKPIPLKSVLIGNGVTSPKAMFKSYFPVACTSTSGYGPVLSENECREMKNRLPECEILCESCEQIPRNSTRCIQANDFCEDSQFGPYYRSGRNPYDMTEFGDYEESEWINSFFNEKVVRWALGVDKEVTKFTECSDKVMDHFLSTGDGTKPSYIEIAELLDNHNIDVLIYAGEKDFICNWISNEAWTLDLDWSLKEEFNSQKLTPWYSFKNGKKVIAGKYRSTGRLTFATVAGAGHFVPYNQPETSLTM